MYTPGIRAHMEQIIKDVAEARVTKDEAISVIKDNMRQNYLRAYSLSNELMSFIREFFQENISIVYS